MKFVEKQQPIQRDMNLMLFPTQHIPGSSQINAAAANSLVTIWNVINFDNTAMLSCLLTYNSYMVYYTLD